MSAFYNENDPRAAAWLRELIAAGHIAPGIVDERSISDIRPEELYAHTQCHFFAGIGGWSLALRLAGWPDSRPVWTGSCPCQPFSAAGQGLAEADPRHLWPVFRELIRGGKPPVTFGEQVASKLGREWLAGVRADLEAMGHEVGAADLCAPSLGAPHIRQRLFWMANANMPGGHEWTRGGEQPIHHENRRIGGPANPKRNGGRADEQERQAEERAFGRSSGVSASRLEQPEIASLRGHMGGSRREGAAGKAEARQDIRPTIGDSGAWSDFDLLPCRDGKTRRIESGTFPLAHGIPGRVGLLRGYGNAIVPQVAATFIQAAIESLTPATEEAAR